MALSVKTELAGVRKELKFTPSEWEEVRRHLSEQGKLVGTSIKPATYFHDLVLQRARGLDEGDTPAYVDTALQQFRTKLLTKAPAGPWEEALAHAGDFVLSTHVAEELEARDGDVVVRAVGESMEGRGIFDQSLLLMRPLAGRREPRRGEITLVQAVDAEGNYFATIKAWIPGIQPSLQDGEGKHFKIPFKPVSVHAVAVARGIIGRLV